MARGVELTGIAERFALENLTPELTLAGRKVDRSEINRPALQLTGFYEYFDGERLQLIGKVEKAYLDSKTSEERLEIFGRLFETKIPCLIICRGIRFPEDEEIKALAVKHNVPIFRTDRSTSEFMTELNRYLYEALAPMISMHGVLVDCFGEGVLITGDSGIGKSETALELIQRGHRLVADDIVEISKISDTELVGRSPKLIENLIELRGIGILDVKQLFGVRSIKTSQSIDMVIHLEPWEQGKNYNRTGIEYETTKILGAEVECYSIPIMPGRNMAIIVESAAINHRQKKMGYNATAALIDRVSDNVSERRKEKQQNNQ